MHIKTTSSAWNVLRYICSYLGVLMCNGNYSVCGQSTWMHFWIPLFMTRIHRNLSALPMTTGPVVMGSADRFPWIQVMNKGIQKYIHVDWPHTHRSSWWAVFNGKKWIFILTTDPLNWCLITRFDYLSFCVVIYTMFTFAMVLYMYRKIINGKQIACLQNCYEQL